MEFELLLQRLRVRLGEHAIIRPRAVESYLPERAWRAAVNGESSGTVQTQIVPRPFSLFPMPIEIGVTSRCNFRCDYCGAYDLAERRILSVDDVARAFLYLATAEATTGCVITVDGGNAAAFPR